MRSLLKLNRQRRLEHLLNFQLKLPMIMYYRTFKENGSGSGKLLSKNYSVIQRLWVFESAVIQLHCNRFKCRANRYTEQQCQLQWYLIYIRHQVFCYRIINCKSYFLTWGCSVYLHVMYSLWAQGTYF